MPNGSWFAKRRPVRRHISILGAVAAITFLGACGGAQTPTGQPAARSGQAAPLAAPAGQTVLPFTGLDSPVGVAVDTAGNVYVTDKLNSRVLKLAAGATTATVLPFPMGRVNANGTPITGTDGLLVEPAAVAVDKVGNLYVSDCNTSRVWKLAAGSNTPIVLLTGLLDVFGLAVDSAANLYGTAANVLREGHYLRTVGHYGLVWKLAAPTTPNGTWTELPFPGLNNPIGVAVDTTDNLYVTDDPRGPNYGEKVGDPQLGSHQVVKQTADLTTQTVLPFTGLHNPGGVAVDSTGNLFVTDNGNSRVLKLAAGSSTQAVLPFSGLHWPHGVAVDTAGNLYVTDTGNNRVLKLGLGKAS
jgi:serine/threonine-protein kinase